MTVQSARRSRLVSFVIAIAMTPLALGQDSNTERADEAKALIKAFATELGGALKKEMKSGGPEAAVGVCRDLAPAIANRISLEKGWRVTRVGTRVRNAMLGTPDAWEQTVLQQFQSRADSGESFETMAHGELVTEPEGQYFRFMKAIGVQEVCLTCHGNPADMPESLRATLDEKYPHDRAVGYQLNDLRGAFSIKQPVE